MPGRCSNTTSPPNGFKSRGRVRRTLDLIGCPPTRSMLRLPRRGMRGTPPGFNRVHDSGRSRHQHHRLGPLAAARAARADFYADAQRFASTLRQWSYLRGVRRGNQPPPLWPRPRYYRRDSGNHTRQGVLGEAYPRGDCLPGPGRQHVFGMRGGGAVCLLGDRQSQTFPGIVAGYGDCYGPDDARHHPNGNGNDARLICCWSTEVADCRLTELTAVGRLPGRAGAALSCCARSHAPRETPGLSPPFGFRSLTRSAPVSRDLLEPITPSVRR